MTRLTIGFALLTGMLALLSAGFIRAELTAPGVSLFLGSDGAPNGQDYNRMVTLHGLTGLGFAGWLGLAFAQLGIQGGARLHRLWIWPGLIVPAYLTGVAALFTFTPSLPQLDALGGWSLLPPDPGGYSTDLFLRAPLMLAAQVAATGLLIAGLIAFLGRFDGFRGFSYLGALATLGLMAFILAQQANFRTGSEDYLYLLAMLVLVGGASVLLIDKVPPALPLIALGTLFCIIAASVLLTSENLYSFGETMTTQAAKHISVYALPLLAFPALVIALGHRTPPPWVIWGAPVAIGGALVLAYRPLALLGRDGMPTRYADFPNAFAPGNLQATLGAILLGLTLFVVLLLIQRSRR